MTHKPSVSLVIRSGLMALLLCSFGPAVSAAQPIPDVRPGISGSVVRVFGGIGYTFAIDIRTEVPVDVLNANHSVGLTAWYGTADVVMGTYAGGEREMLGAGANWRTGFRFADGKIRPYVSFPLQYVTSSIENTRWLLPTVMQEQPPIIPPTYNQPGTARGFAYGVGVGSEFWPIEAIGLGASMTALRHNLYDDHGPPWLFFSFGLLYATDRL